MKAPNGAFFGEVLNLVCTVRERPQVAVEFLSLENKETDNRNGAGKHNIYLSGNRGITTVNKTLHKFIEVR